MFAECSQKRQKTEQTYTISTGPFRVLKFEKRWQNLYIFNINNLVKGPWHESFGLVFPSSPEAHNLFRNKIHICKLFKIIVWSAQGCGSGSALDRDSVSLWIRICIGNPDPISGSRGKKIVKIVSRGKNSVAR
jgi:hypothetical protein